MKASVRDVRRRNRSLLLRELVLGGTTSRVALGATTGLSPATVTSVVTELLEEGTVRETGFLDSQGGRRRVLLEVDPTAYYVFGADVSETQITTGLYGLTLERITERSVPFEARHIDPDRAADVLVTQVEEILADRGIDRAKVLGLGLGVPGVVENPTTTYAVVHAEVIGWDRVTFDDLEDALGFPVLIDNGAKTTTQGEAWFGSARDTQHAIVTLIGDGVGAGIVTNGRLYRGASSSAGEWGHTKINLSGPACRCGSSGCVEAVVGASRVLNSWTGDDRYAGRAPEGIAALFASQDDAARRALTGVIDHLGLAIANLVNLYNPEKIIVGGWFGDRIAGEHLESLRESVRRFSLEQPGQQAVVERSQLGMAAVTLGAATLPIDRFIESGLAHITTTQRGEDDAPTSSRTA